MKKANAPKYHNPIIECQRLNEIVIIPLVIAIKRLTLPSSGIPRFGI